MTQVDYLRVQAQRCRAAAATAATRRDASSYSGLAAHYERHMVRSLAAIGDRVGAAWTCPPNPAPDPVLGAAKTNL